MFFPNASIEPDTRVFDCYNGKELAFESAEPQPTPGTIPKSYNLYSGSNAYVKLGLGLGLTKGSNAYVANQRALLRPVSGDSN